MLTVWLGLVFRVREDELPPVKSDDIWENDSYCIISIPSLQCLTSQCTHLVSQYLCLHAESFEAAASWTPAFSECARVSARRSFWSLCAYLSIRRQVHNATKIFPCQGPKGHWSSSVEMGLPNFLLKNLLYFYYAPRKAQYRHNIYHLLCHYQGISLQLPCSVCFDPCCLGGIDQSCMNPGLRCSS